MTKNRTRNNYYFLALLGFLVGSILFSVSTGPAQISLLEVCQALLSSAHSYFSDLLVPGQALWQQSVVANVRLPRVLTGAFVGASYALCGVVLQGLFRNPLASPSVLGVSSGASLGAVVAIFFGLAAISAWVLPVFSFIGASLTMFVVYSIATRRGHTPISTLLLAGVAISAFNVAMYSFILSVALQHWEVGKSIVYWSMGGLDGRTWDHVILILPAFVVCFTFITAYQRDLDALLMGEIHASSVGVDVAKTRLTLLIITSALIAMAVAVAGGITFVGLVVPHIVRLIIGPHHRFVIPLSALLGAIVIVLSDLMLRGIFYETRIPLGVITASMGAPFFLFLLLKQRKLMQA
ncbi:iron ABC transporter [Gammaproteobacteria bacterium 42_54_T18]|nr:iron ABC transporter [Gammaproteobacteria bacterium 42_54_T18]